VVHTAPLQPRHSVATFAQAHFTTHFDAFLVGT
jgi:hypothetical protein